MPGDRRLSPLAVVLVGHATITIPTAIVFIASYVVLRFVLGPALAALAFAMVVPCWLWWAWLVPKWRDWVVSQGVDVDAVQRLAVLTGLLWPRGSLPEKTEFRRRNGQRGW